MPLNIKLPEAPAIPDTEKMPVSPADRLIKAVTFFGDSAIPEGDPIYNSVQEVAKLLAQNKYVIVNGGGPGIMKAATDGAAAGGGKTVAVYWQPKLASFFEGKNLANVTNESETSSNYLIRTLELIEKGDAYVVCKGGTGTISEFAMVWCLAKLYYGSHKPVILYGDFWDPIIDAFQKNMNIDEIELSVLYRANSPEQVLKQLQEHESRIKFCRDINFVSDEEGFILGHRDSGKTMQNYNQNASSYHSEHVGKLVAQDQLDEFETMVNAPAQVLDIGSGPGYDAGYLAQKYSVTGVELSKRFMQIAQFENPNVNFVNADITKYDIGQNRYRGIWTRDSIHHIPEAGLDDLFKKIADSLVEDGVFYTIVREGSGEVVEKETSNYVTTEKFFHLFSEDELRERAQKAGLKVVKIDRKKRSHDWLIGVFKK